MNVEQAEGAIALGHQEAGSDHPVIARRRGSK